MTYKEEKRDLFTVPNDYYLAQCISADFAMDAGIALQFNKYFNTKNILKEKYGDMLFEWEMTAMAGFCVKEGKVFNLITKRYCYEKPSEATLFNALQALKEQLIENDIEKIAMPRIAAGLDKMSWKTVKELIFEVFEDTDIEILVCIK